MFTCLKVSLIKVPQNINQCIKVFFVFSIYEKKVPRTDTQRNISNTFIFLFLPPGHYTSHASSAEAKNKVSA